MSSDPTDHAGRQHPGRSLLIAVVLVAALIAVVFLTGWADDKATPGTRGRGTVNTTTTP